VNGDTSPVAAATASFVSSRLRHTLINRLYTDEACSTFASLATATGDGQLIVVPTTPCKSTKTISFEQKMYIKATKVDHTYTWLRSAQTV